MNIFKTIFLNIVVNNVQISFFFFLIQFRNNCVARNIKQILNTFKWAIIYVRTLTIEHNLLNQ